MKFSGVSVNLTGNDLLSIINDFLNVEGLDISKVELNKDISITGVFKKGVAINFTGKIKLGKIENGKIYGEVSAFKILNIGIISIFRKLALKYAVKSFEDKGIYYEKGKVIINIKKILNDIPFVDFDIDDIYLTNSMLNVAVSNLNISLSGDLVKEEIKEEIKEIEDILENDDETTTIEKMKDNYTVGRNYVAMKLPKKVKKAQDYLFIIPDLVALLYRLLKDKRVPIKTKLVISAAIAYTTIPTDIIPDDIPFIGRVDEIAVIFFALDRIVTDIEVNVLLENWQGKNEIIFVFKNIIDYVINFTGAKNVEKIYSFVNELASL